MFWNVTSPCTHPPGCGQPLPPARLFRVTLIEGKEILGSFDASLREYAARALVRSGVQLLKGVVRHMDENTIVLQASVRRARCR